MKNFFSYLLFSNLLVAIPLPYEAGELRFRVASQDTLACLAHDNFCIVSVPPELEKKLINFYQQAVINKNTVIIERKNIPNILVSEEEIDKFIKVSKPVKKRDRNYFFDYSQISYKNNLLGDGGKIVFKPPFHDKKKIEIRSEELMMELIRQINFIRKNKKTVKINFDFLKKNAGNDNAHGLKLLSIDPRIPSH